MFPNTYPIGCQHILRLLFLVLHVHLKGVSLSLVLLEQGQLLLGRAAQRRGLPTRGHRRRATLTHKLKLLDRRRWDTGTHRELLLIRVSYEKSMRLLK